MVKFQGFTIFCTVLTPVYPAVETRASNDCTLGVCIATSALFWVETIIHYNRGDNITVLLADVRMWIIIATERVQHTFNFVMSSFTPSEVSQTRSELHKDSNRHVLFNAIVMLVCAIPKVWLESTFSKKLAFLCDFATLFCSSFINNSWVLLNSKYKIVAVFANRYSISSYNSIVLLLSKLLGVWQLLMLSFVCFSGSIWIRLYLLT